MPTDDEVIAYIREHPGVRLAALCDALSVPWAYSPLRLSPDGLDYGYTTEAKRLAAQLQRLRRTHKLRTTQGQGWEVRE